MIRINLSNTKKLYDAIDKFAEKATQVVDDVVSSTAFEVELKAKENASVKQILDKGDLIQNIRAEKQEQPLTWKITSYMPYSAYHEFGTGGLVDVPAEWQQMASYFKGKGIKQVNIQPRPFMYPAYLFGRNRFNKDLREELKVLTQKFNG